MRNPLLLTATAGLLLASAASFAAAPTARPEVGKPLQEAHTLLQGKKYKDALAKVGEAEKVGNLNAYESYLVARLRAAAAQGAGDYATALKAYETITASDQLPAAEKGQTLGIVAQLAYAAKNYPKAVDAIKSYQAAGGSDANITGLLPQALYLANQYGEAQKALNAQIATMEKAGQAPTETQLQLLASCALKQNDNNGYVAALEKLVQYHPSESYWLDLIVRTSNKPGFSDRLALDLYRLRRQTGNLKTTNDYLEAAQLALQAGFPGEADGFVKEGYEKKLLGTGAQTDIDRHNRLRDLVSKKITEDKATLAEGEKAAAAQATGDALVATGFNYVAYGDTAKGVALMEQGIAKGGLKKPDEAKLHLGYAYLLAGQKDKARSTLRGVQGKEGTQDLARLWTLAARAA